jgi:hypothetical protein
MAGIDRTTIMKGPALVTFGGQSFWSKGDVSVSVTNKLFGIGTAHFGEVDQRVSDRMVEVNFEPEGRFTAGLAAVLWPYAATALGASIYGGSDRALVVWARDGKKLTVHNASVTGMPNLRLGVAKTIEGPVKFTGLLKNSTDPSNAAAYYTLTTATYPGDTGWAVSDVLTKAYASAWGSAPWDAFHTEDGWEISFGLQLKPQMVDGLGTVDMSLQGLTVSAKCIPVGPAESDILSHVLPASALGNSVAAVSEHLLISASGIAVVVYNAGITDSGFVFGAEKKRIGPTEWKATRTVTAGVADPLFYVGTSSPL